MKTTILDRRPTFALSRLDEKILREAAIQRGYSRSQLIRELIRGNVSLEKAAGAVETAIE